MALRRKKIPAILQNDGQPLKTAMIDPYQIRQITDDVVEVREGMKNRKQHFFDKHRCMFGPFANNIKAALMNPHKIDLFCPRAHICFPQENQRIEELRNEVSDKNTTISSMKRSMAHKDEQIRQAMSVLSKMDRPEAKKIMEDLTKSTAAQITV